MGLHLITTGRAPATRREPDLDAQDGAGADIIRLYLNGIGRSALLTAAQEVDLARRIEAGLYAAHLLGAGVTDEARAAELRLVVRDGRAAKTRLLESNLRLVVSIAKRYGGRGLPLLDLIQEGNLGLIRAVEKFDFAKGYKFSTYATWWIRQAISRALADQSRTIRLPVHMAEQVSKVARARRDLAATLGREPGVDDVAAALGLTRGQVLELMGYDREPVSLDQAVGGDGESVLADFVTPVVTDCAADPALRGEVESMLAVLSSREQAVIRLRFGLDDGRHRTLEEVGAECGLSRERVRQIERGTLAKLRRPALAA